MKHKITIEFEVDENEKDILYFLETQLEKVKKNTKNFIATYDH